MECEHRFELAPVHKDGFDFKIWVCHRCRHAWTSIRDPQRPGRPVWRVVDDDGNLEEVERPAPRF